MNNQHSKIAGLNTYVGKTVPSFSSPKHFAKIVLVVLSCSREEHLYVFILYSNLPRITACSSPNINLWYQFAIYILYTSHCNIDFDRVVLISDFYARISKNGCLNKTQTFPIIHILCISYKHILWSISFGFKFCGL